MSNLKIKSSNEGGVEIFALEGSIDENSDYSQVSVKGDKAILNFNGITRINSTGIQKWIKFMNSIPDNVQLEYVQCPICIIEQINMFSGFSGKHPVKISSFYTPYFCEACEKSHEELLKATDVKISGDDYSFPIGKCSKCSEQLEFDGIEEKYFQFLKK